MLSCGMWFSAPSFWMGGGLESRCVGRVCGADGAVHSNIRKSASNAPDDGRMYPKHVEIQYINKITLLNQVGISNYFMRKMDVQTTFKLNGMYVEGSYGSLFLSTLSDI